MDSNSVAIISELKKLKGVEFEAYGRKIKVDFNIDRKDSDILIVLDDSIPDWWNIYWQLKYMGLMDGIIRLRKEQVGYCHIVGSATYTDCTWNKMNGAVITIMI